MTADRNVWALSVLISLAGLGCHAAPPAPVSGASDDGSENQGAGGREEPRDDPQDEPQDEPQPDVMDPTDPSLEVDPQVCEVDSDCMVGTPRDCCTSFCPEHAVAWSHAAWEAYQQMCAVVECNAPESLACRPERERSPAPSARCVRERCVLR